MAALRIGGCPEEKDDSEQLTTPVVQMPGTA